MEALENFVESNTQIVVSVTITDFHLHIHLIFLSSLVNLVSFPSVGLSETVETTAAGLGGVGLLQNT